MKKEKRRAWQLHLKATHAQFKAPEFSLGPWTSYSLRHDPKHLVFVLSRYKFCAKMLEGKRRVLEVGCGDGFGAPIVAQSVERLHCVDWEERNIARNIKRYAFLKNASFECLDASQQALSGHYDAAFLIDVLEHLEKKYENNLMKNVCRALVPSGVLIVGMPNKCASAHATERSSSQHINLKTAAELRRLVERYFENCFMFSMNDEVIHTGFAPMAHYLFAVGAGKKR